MAWHAAIPWDWWRRTYLAMRGRFFSKHPPAEGYLRVDAPLDELAVVLGHEGYAPQDTLSYDKGETLNLAFQYWDDRGIFAPRADLSRTLHGLTGGRLGSITEEPVEWWQIHVRAWVIDGVVYLTAHFEPSARHEDSAHINGVGFDHVAGVRRLKQLLDEHGIGYVPVGEPPGGLS